MASSYKFPNVDFSWLGELPSVADEARKRRLQQSLGDIDTSTPTGLEKAASRLISGGDIDSASKLYALANTRRGIEQRNADQERFNSLILPRLLDPKSGVYPAAGASSTDESIPADALPGPVSRPAAPDTSGPAGFPGRPAPLTPFPKTSEAGPVAPVGIAPIAPVDTSPPPDTSPPTETPPVMEGNPAPPVQPPAPTPPSPAAAAPPVPAAPPIPQTQSSAVPAEAPSGPLPPTGFNPLTSPTPGPAPVAPLPQRMPVMPGQSPDDLGRLRQLGNLYLLADKGAGPGQRDAIKTEINRLQQQMKWTDSQKEYYDDMLQRRSVGEPMIGFGQWRDEAKVLPESYKEAQQHYASIYDKGAQAREIQQSITAMRSISRSPSFIGGSVPLLNRGVELLSGLTDLARSAGVDPKYIPDIKGMDVTNGVALREAYNSLASKTALSLLGGSLGRQISDSDRKFISQMGSALDQTEAGRELIMEIYDRAAQRSVAALNAANAYREAKGARATSYGMDRVVEENANKYPLLVDENGNKTELGRRVEATTGGKTVLQTFNPTGLPEGTPGSDPLGINEVKQGYQMAKEKMAEATQQGTEAAQQAREAAKPYIERAQEAYGKAREAVGGAIEAADKALPLRVPGLGIAAQRAQSGTLPPGNPDISAQLPQLPNRVIRERPVGLDTRERIADEMKKYPGFTLQRDPNGSYWAVSPTGHYRQRLLYGGPGR